MKNYFRLSALIVSTILASNLTHAQQDKNLIPVATAETSGYDTFNAYVLKNSIKRPTSTSAVFKLLLTGVSTTEMQQNVEPTPVPNEERIEEYDLNDSRVILTVNMNCKTKTTTVEKIMSIDPDTGNLKEQKNESTDQDQDKNMNNALYKIICK